MSEKARKKLAERFDQFSDEEYLKFESIPQEERLHPSHVLCGYLKVASLMKKHEEFDIHAEHDVAYLCGSDDLLPLTDEDIIYLLRCGIGYYDDEDCLQDFC